MKSDALAQLLAWQDASPVDAPAFWQKAKELGLNVIWQNDGKNLVLQLAPDIGLQLTAVAPFTFQFVPWDSPPPPPSTSIESAVPWLHAFAYLERVGGDSEETRKTYLVGLRIFAEWIQIYQKENYAKSSVWPMDPTHLTTADIQQFEHWLAQTRARSTTATYIAALMGFFNYLEMIHELPSSLNMSELRAYLRSTHRRQNQSSQHVLEMSDVRSTAVPQIVRYYEDLPLPPVPSATRPDSYQRRLTLLRDRAVVNLLYATAMRIAELPPLNRSAVRDGRSPTAYIIGKGNKPRTIYLQPYAQQAIQAYLAERTDTNPALFVSHTGNHARTPTRISKRTLQRTIENAARVLGFEGVSAHDFRHFRATQLLREGMPLEVVQEYLGHTSPATTRMIYSPVLGERVVREWLDNMDIPPTHAIDR